jgi:hypothetical protein
MHAQERLTVIRHPTSIDPIGTTGSPARVDAFESGARTSSECGYDGG